MSQTGRAMLASVVVITVSLSGAQARKGPPRHHLATPSKQTHETSRNSLEFRTPVYKPPKMTQGWVR